MTRLVFLLPVFLSVLAMYQVNPEVTTFSSKTLCFTWTSMATPPNSEPCLKIVSILLWKIFGDIDFRLASSVAVCRVILVTNSAHALRLAASFTCALHILDPFPRPAWQVVD